MSVPNPKECKGCKRRHENCWSSCPSYIKFDKENKAYKKKVRDITRAENDWASVVFHK